jgi:hypothetical protein
LVKRGNGNSGYGETMVTLTFGLSDGSQVVKQEFVSGIKWGVNTVRTATYSIGKQIVTVTITITPTGNNLNQLAISNITTTYAVSTAGSGGGDDDGGVGVGVVSLGRSYSALVKQGNGNNGYGETTVTLTFDLSDGSQVVKQEFVSGIKWGVNTVKTVTYSIGEQVVTVTITIVPTGNNLSQLAISNVTATYTVTSTSG